MDLTIWKKHELNPNVANEEAIDWIFVVDTLNFSFWPDGEEIFTVNYRGKLWTGDWSLCAAIDRAIDVNRIWINVELIRSGRNSNT